MKVTVSSVQGQIEAGLHSRLRAMAVQASPAEIEAGSLSDEKLRSFVDGFDARGCTPPLLRLTPSSCLTCPWTRPPYSQTPYWAG